MSILDPERAQEKLEAMEASRRRMQEKFDAEAARYAEQQKIVCSKLFFFMESGIFYTHCNGVARRPKSFAHQRENTVLDIDSLQLCPFSNWNFS